MHVIVDPMQTNTQFVCSSVNNNNNNAICIAHVSTLKNAEGAYCHYYPA